MQITDDNKNEGRFSQEFLFPAICAPAHAALSDRAPALDQFLIARCYIRSWRIATLACRGRVHTVEIRPLSFCPHWEGGTKITTVRHVGSTAYPGRRDSGSMTAQIRRKVAS